MCVDRVLNEYGPDGDSELLAEPGSHGLSSLHIFALQFGAGAGQWPVAF